MYEPRNYRHWAKSDDLTSFNVRVEETDLCICASTNLERKTLKLVSMYREMLQGYIERHPSFQTSLKPITISSDAPAVVRAMAEAAEKVGVGPMASIAGAIAEFVGSELLEFTPEIIIENGGDIFMKSLKKRQVGIYAGESLLSGRIGLEIEAEDTPLGICTSSGTVGHSLSFGKADAALVVARSTVLADAAATAIGNLVKAPGDIEYALKWAEGIKGLKGVVITQGEHIGLLGDIKICSMHKQDDEAAKGAVGG
jgi:ApbE superfamily uncharacterized protein (UPF0280 family)